MNVDLLYDAIGEINTEYIEDSNSKPHFLQTSKFHAMVAMFLVVLMLSIPAHAEMVNGYVSNLLAPLYNGSQTAVIDKIGVPLDSTVTVGDYTLSADAVIGDKYNIATVYSLSRTDGMPLPEGICFDSHENSLRSGSGAGALDYHLNEDYTVLYVVETWTSAKSLFLDRMANITFTDLMLFDNEAHEYHLLESGEWKLKYTVRYEDSSLSIPGGDIVFADNRGKEYTVHQITLSPIGIHIEMTAPNPYANYRDGVFAFGDVSLSIEFGDGTLKEISNLSFEDHGDVDAETHEVNLGALFDAPVELDQIMKITLCDTSIAIN